MRIDATGADSGWYNLLIVFLKNVFIFCYIFLNFQQTLAHGKNSIDNVIFGFSAAK